MRLMKYLPSITQAIQVFILMVLLTTFGLVAKGRAFVGKITGR